MAINWITKPDQNKIHFSGDPIPLVVGATEGWSVRFFFEFKSSSGDSVYKYDVSVRSKQAKLDLSPFVHTYQMGRIEDFEYDQVALQKFFSGNGHMEVVVHCTEYSIEGSALYNLQPIEFNVLRGTTAASTAFMKDKISDFSAILSFAPKTSISPKCPATFSWYHSQVGTVILGARFYFGTVSTEADLSELYTQETVLHFYYTYEKLRTIAGADFSGVDFYMKNSNGSKRSTVKSYAVDLQEHPQERVLIFLNSIGGLDTVRLLGTGEEKSTYSRTVLSADGHKRNADINRTKQLEVSTGYYAAQHSNPSLLQNFVVQEALSAERAYLLTGYGFLEVAIENEEERSFQDNLYLDETVFSLSVTRVLRAFTPQEMNLEEYYNKGYIADGYI